MPIYEYTCQDCQNHFQARRAMRDADAPLACPQCGAKRAKRGLSLFAAHSSSGKALAGGGASCGSCSSSSCGSCGHKH